LSETKATYNSLGTTTLTVSEAHWIGWDDCETGVSQSTWRNRTKPMKIMGNTRNPMVIQWHLMGFNGIYDDIPGLVNVCSLRTGKIHHVLAG